MKIKNVEGKNYKALIRNFKNSLWDDEINSFWDDTSNFTDEDYEKAHYRRNILTEGKSITSRAINTIVCPHGVNHMSKEQAVEFIEELKEKLDIIKENYEG